MGQMRNVFDQYEQPENKLTHALLSTLNGDRRLLRPFLGWLGGGRIPPAGKIRIGEQQAPGTEAEAEMLCCPTATKGRSRSRAVDAFLAQRRRQVRPGRSPGP